MAKALISTKISCARCGVDAPKRQGFVLYCRQCAVIRLKEGERKHEARRGGPNYRPLGSVVHCADCKTEIVLRSALHKYCDACKAIRRKATFKSYRQSEKGQRLSERAESRRRKNAQRLEYMRSYIPQYSKERRKEPKHRLNHRMSSMVGRGLRAGKQGRKWSALVGYDLSDLMRHVERQFLVGMTWNNIGEWHIDHIVPLSSFEFNAPEDEEFKAAWALANLRPLWSAQNLAKRDHRIFLI